MGRVCASKFRSLRRSLPASCTMDQPVLVLLISLAPCSLGPKQRGMLPNAPRIQDQLGKPYLWNMVSSSFLGRLWNGGPFFSVWNGGTFTFTPSWRICFSYVSTFGIFLRVSSREPLREIVHYHWWEDRICSYDTYWYIQYTEHR